MNIKGSVKKSYRVPKTLYQAIVERVARHKSNGPRWVPVFIQLLVAIGGAYFAYQAANREVALNAQTAYVNQKVQVYTHLAELLKDGRDPHSRRHDLDTLIVHSDSSALLKWWYNIDNYFQTNYIFFDDLTKQKVTALNQFVFDQADSLVAHPNADIEYKHSLKQPIVDKCNAVLVAINSYLEGHFQFDRVITNPWP